MTNVIELPNPERSLAAPGMSRFPTEGSIWLLITAVMFITGLFKGINLLVLLAYLLFGLWIVNWILVRHFAKRLQARRLPHEPIVVGIPAELRLEIESVGKHSPRGVTILDSGPDHAGAWFILQLAPQTVIRLRFRHVFQKRGRYPTAPLRARTQFPFGLVRRTVELSPTEEWIVLPRLGRLDVERLKEWLAKTTRGDGRVRRHRLQAALQEADIHGLRDFRSGDSPRWIHWRSSARRNQVLVREFEDNMAPELVIVVEPWLPEHPSPEEQAQLEAVISMAATICREWCRELLARLTVIISGLDAVVLPAGAGSEFSLRALEALAVQEGTHVETTSRWIDRLQHVKLTTSVLVLTSRPSSALAAEIAASLGRSVAQVVAGETVPWMDNG